MRTLISELRKLSGIQNETKETVPLDSLNKDTVKLLKELQGELKRRGYKYKFYKASATGEWEWTKGNTRIALGGWHGTGKGSGFYGPGKVVWTVYGGDWTKQTDHKEHYDWKGFLNTDPSVPMGHIEKRLADQYRRTVLPAIKKTVLKLASE